MCSDLHHCDRFTHVLCDNFPEHSVLTETEPSTSNWSVRHSGNVHLKTTASLTASTLKHLTTPYHLLYSSRLAMQMYHRAHVVGLDISGGQQVHQKWTGCVRYGVLGSSQETGCFVRTPNALQGVTQPSNPQMDALYDLAVQTIKDVKQRDLPKKKRILL